jgi:DNA polymerase-3 subunit alpha
LIVPGTPLLVTVDLKAEGDGLRITASDVARLDDAAAEIGGEMRIWLDRADAVPSIRSLLTREGRGRGRVVLIPRLGAHEEVEVNLPGFWPVSPLLAQAMKAVPGVERVEQA